MGNHVAASNSAKEIARVRSRSDPRKLPEDVLFISAGTHSWKPFGLGADCYDVDLVGQPFGGGRWSSGDDSVDDLSVNIGQAKVSTGIAESESFVVEA